jgi:nucleotide-binding universal stress UspA family protein
MAERYVLVPMDGSGRSLAALPYAEAVARATGAAVHLLAVVEREPGGAVARPGFPRTVLEEMRRVELTRQLEETAAPLRGRGLTVTTDLAYGEPADEILVAADAEPVTMTVMATHGRGAAQRMIVGSVADKVMRLSGRPTLLVRAQEGEVEAKPIVLRRVMVPLDGSPAAEHCLVAASELASATGATLTLVRVEPYISVSTSPYEPVGVDLASMEAEIAAAAHAYLEDVRSRLPAGFPVETVVLRGFAAAMLIDFVTSGQVDLVVMTTHGRSGVRRLVLGSVADRMVRSGVPVLLTRPVPAARPGAGADLAYHCASCGRLITVLPERDERCPRCEVHLHACANCVFWDTTGCVLQRAEAYNQSWPGRDCPRFIFRETPAPPGAPHLIDAGEAR